MSGTDAEFFKDLGIDPQVGDEEEVPSKEKTTEALRGPVQMVAVIRDEALKQGMSKDEAFELASAYYNMFLGVNFMAAQYHVGMNPDGEG